MARLKRLLYSRPLFIITRTSLISGFSPEPYSYLMRIDCSSLSKAIDEVTFSAFSARYAVLSQSCETSHASSRLTDWNDQEISAL